MKILNMIPIEDPINHWLIWGKPIVIAFAIGISIILIVRMMYWMIDREKEKEK